MPPLRHRLAAVNGPETVHLRDAEAIVRKAGDLGFVRVIQRGLDVGCQGQRDDAAVCEDARLRSLTRRGIAVGYPFLAQRPQHVVERPVLHHQHDDVTYWVWGRPAVLIARGEDVIPRAMIKAKAIEATNDGTPLRISAPGGERSLL